MGGGKSTSTTAPRLNGINIQSSVFGSAIPRGWGTFRVPANLLWYGDFQAIATTTKTKTGGKGGGGTNKSTTYSYKAALILGICAGPIAAIRTVYKDQSVFAGWSALSQAGLSLMAGYDGQAVWGHLSTRHPDQAIGYSGIAYAYASAYSLSDSAVVSNHSFEVVMPDLVPGTDDASPRLIVEQFLSEIPGWPSGVLSDLSDYGDYCLASGLLLSPVMTAQVQAAEFLKDVLRATNSEAFMSEGKVKITPYGDTEVTGNGVTWTPNLTPIYDLDDSVFIPPSEGDDPLTFDLKRPADAFNIVQVEYLDRGHQYAVAMAPGIDQASIDQFGARKADPARLHVICDSGVADKVADLLVRRTAGMRTTFSFRLPWNYVLLDPMDLVTVTDLAQGIDRVLVRVLEVNESDDEYEIVCEEMLVGQAAQALITRQPMDGYRPNWDAAPGDALAPIMFNPPRQLTDGALEVWLATAGGEDWGGAEVWASIDGSTYERKGQVNGPARYGYTTSTLPLHADPDSTNAVGVNIALSGGELTPATQEEADDFATLCLIGDEVIAYRDATLTGTGQYTLGYLRRGLMGTTPAAHAAGTRFVRLDGAVESLPYRDDQVGLELYVKLRSFNVHGRAYQELDEVDPYTVTLTPSAATYVPVVWDEVGDRPPVLTDLDEDGRLRPVNVGGLVPGENLYQSLEDILVDVDDLITTYGDTASAAASAAAAAASASATNDALNLAEDAADAAFASSGIAAGHADSAESYRDAASGFSSAASASAVVAMDAFTAARRAAASLLPSTFDQDGRFWGGGGSFAQPPTMPTLEAVPHPSITFATEAGKGRVARVAVSAAYIDIYPTDAIKVTEAHKYRFSAHVRAQTWSSGPNVELYVVGLDANYNYISGVNDARNWGPTTLVPTAGSPYASNWGTISYEPSIAAWMGVYGVVYVRPVLRFQLGGGGNVYDALFVRSEDITESIDAGVFASAASSSAASASDSAASAQSSATLSAAVASASMIGNCRFSDWSIPYSSGWPYPWATADNNMGTGSSVTQVAGEVPGTFAAQVVGGPGAQAYSAQITPEGSAQYQAWFVCEADVRLDLGSLAGAGMYWVTTDAAGTGISSQAIGFTTDPDNNTGGAIGAGVVGRTYRFAKLVQASDNTATSRIRFYAMNHWSGMGDISSTNQLTWFKCNLRPATPDEIELRTARGTSPTLSAKITDVANVAASASSAVATRTSTLEAQVKVNENRLRNPSGAAGMLNWPNTGAAITWSAYVHPTWGSWITGHTYAGGGGTGDAYLYQDFDAEASTWYTLSGWAYCQADGPSWFPYVEYYTSGGSFITGSSRPGFLPGGGNGTFAPWSFQTPAGTARVRFYAYWALPAVNQQVGFSRLKLETGQVATTYSDDATMRTTLSRVSVSEGAIATLNGRNAAWLQQQVEAGSGAAAFVRLYAETSPGVTTSDVSIGAREIHLYNQTTAGFLKALSVVGGNAIFYGGLTAATYIRQGSGEGWPVALAQKDFVGGDGATFSWGLTFDNFPSYIAAMNNLAALSAGETYDIRLNVTKTGATVIAKIITPGSPTNYGPISPDYVGGTSAPDYTVGVTNSSRGESTDGGYNLDIYTSWSSSFYSPTTGEIPAYEGYEGSGNVLVDVFAMKSGVWVLCSTEYFSHYASYGGGYVFSGWNSLGSSYSETRNVQLGTGVQAIGVQYNSHDGAYGPYAGGSASLNTAAWQAPGSSSTTRSATPGGQTTRFTVIPK